MQCVVRRSSVQPTIDSPRCDLETIVLLKGIVGRSSINRLIIVYIIILCLCTIDGPHYDLETAM